MSSNPSTPHSKNSDFDPSAEYVATLATDVANQQVQMTSVQGEMAKMRQDFQKSLDVLTALVQSMVPKTPEKESKPSGDVRKQDSQVKQRDAKPTPRPGDGEQFISMMDTVGHDFTTRISLRDTKSPELPLAGDSAAAKAQIDAHKKRQSMQAGPRHLLKLEEKNEAQRRKFYEDQADQDDDSQDGNGDSPSASGATQRDSSRREKSYKPVVCKITDFFQNYMLSNLECATIHSWLLCVASYESLSPEALRELTVNWWQTVNASLLEELLIFNYSNSKPEEGQTIEEGYCFSRHLSVFQTKGVGYGFILDARTRLDQCNFDAFRILVKLKLVPKTIEEYSVVLIDLVETRFAKGSGLSKFTVTDVSNMHLQFDTYAVFLDAISAFHIQLLEWCYWAADGYDEYKPPVNPVYEGQLGLKRIVVYIFETLGTPYLTTLVEVMDREAAQAKHLLSTKAASKTFDAPRREGVSQKVTTVLELLSAVKARMVNLRDTSRAWRDLKKLEDRSMTDILEVKKRSKRAVYAMQDEEHSGEHEQEELNWLIHATDEALFCDAHDRDFPPRERKPESALYDSHKPRRFPGQDFKPYCYHRLLQIQCNDTCRGRGNDDPLDGWLAARFLINQITRQGGRGSDKLQVLKRSQQELEAVLRKRGISIPNGQTAGAAGHAWQDSRMPQRAAPPRPSGSAPRPTHVPTDNRNDLKKRQFDARLHAVDLPSHGQREDGHREDGQREDGQREDVSALSDRVYEERLEAMMRDKRFSDLFVINDGVASKPGELL